MLMTEDTSRPTELPCQTLLIGPDHEEVVSKMLSTVEAFEQALKGLRELSDDPDYAFIHGLLPGYDWSLEQMQELNDFLRESVPGASA